MNATIRPTLLRNAGLTLLELLVSLAVLSLFMSAASAWLVTTAHASVAVTRFADASLPAGRALELLRADLDEAEPGSTVVEANPGDVRIEMITCHAAGLEPASWRRVEWRWAPSSGRGSDLLRTAAGLPQRTVLRGVARIALTKTAEPHNAPTKPSGARTPELTRAIGTLTLELVAQAESSGVPPFASRGEGGRGGGAGGDGGGDGRGGGTATVFLEVRQ